MGEESYSLPKLSSADSRQAKELTDRAFKLYEKISELKEGDFKGRPKKEHYKYEIPIEDGRYILPLSAKTNISVAMTGNKLCELFALLYDTRYFKLFEGFRAELIKYLPDVLVKLLEDNHNTNNIKLMELLYKDDMDRISSADNMILLNAFDNLELKVGLGAITSTSAITPSKKLELWGEEATDKAKGLVQRVLGYGHESIAEQARTTFGMMCSMVTYHQQIRHRLPENHREDLTNLILDTKREVVIPPSIKKSAFCQEYLNLVNEFKEFRLYILKEYGEEKALAFILNCDQIKLIISTNVRIDNTMLAERICMNAQWEIRKLSTKKLRVLRELSEILYENSLPSCIHGKCKEGKLTCGKQLEMRKKFLS